MGKSQMPNNKGVVKEIIAYLLDGILCSHLKWQLRSVIINNMEMFLIPGKMKKSVWVIWSWVIVHTYVERLGGNQ